MKEMLEEIRAGGQVVDVLNAHRSEVLRYAAILLVLLTAVLFMSYRGNTELDIAEAAEPADEVKVTEADSPEAGGTEANEEVTAAGTEADKEVTAAGSVFVDIGGAVREPKMAELPQGSRVEDAILSAGGLAENADLSTVNRAAVLSDGEKIYIPAEGEDPAAVNAAVSQAGSGGAAAGTSTQGTGETTGNAGAAGSSGNGGAAGSLININTADLDALQNITGVGPATARKSIDYRTQNGAFKKTEDLKNISGIGEKTYEKMKDQITI